MQRANAAGRFSDRVADYVRYRPDYPRGLIEWLRVTVQFRSGWRVADIGAGTGISSKLLLDAGLDVVAVEPNAAMREAAIDWLDGNPHFAARAGSAESTGLDSHTVDMVTVAQAFHWIDAGAAKAEFRRILKREGAVAVWWNSRRLGGTPFLDGYERLLREFGTDYVQVAEQYNDDASMRGWFASGLVAAMRFPHRQRLDFDGLRLLSSSYAPKPGHPRHGPMLQALQELFDTTQRDGFIDLDYDTRAFAGILD